MIKIQKKVILIGNFSVGKTSLIKRFVENSFSDDYISTIGVKISKKNVQIYDQKATLLIWDIEGATKIKPINTIYARGAHGAIIVIDVQDKKYPEQIKEHIRICNSVVKEIPSVLVFNKIDLEPDFRANIEELKSQYPQIKGSFYTSAKTGEEVEEMFFKIAKEIK